MMKKIFIGMILVFLDLNWDIGACRIGLIPDFIGYIYMINGVTELMHFSSRFVKIKSYITGMAIYSLIFYAMDLFAITPMFEGPPIFFLGLVSSIFSLFISYDIIMGIKDIELGMSWQLNADQLYATWKVLAIFTLGAFIYYLIPALAWIFVIVGFIVAVYYLYMFNKTKKLFIEQNV